MSTEDILTPRGELEIWKVYDDGRPDECVFEDHNIITNGLGISLAYLFAGEGSDLATDYQINYFQVGTVDDTADVTLEELSGALTEEDYKDTGSLLVTEDRKIIVNNSPSQGTQTFVRIPYTQIQKIGSKTVRYTIIIDKNSANNLGSNLKQIGLFMKNPRGLTDEASVLIAYRTFNLPKAPDFALVFKWSIIF